ncbi:ABC transporter ATP-binding protein [Romboutsia sedimentorum]|uniref:ABC transporter ATP-binding protein n=1 Tax=Romboutsia sedimentorum TaxID=1368474 RepID=A0ABT7E6R2_9FIRM|nr:ABC transporter ATP-binding protein [Romboutsia sedimentorum]MDK2562572.1 ABC transporter ATP-binding protein [Romboutsia sedimentorum]
MILTIKGINKKFKDKIAVNDFNATLNTGIYGLLGLNGAGKTTLLRILADVSNESSGCILVDGKNKKDLGEKYRELIGYLPQDVGFYKNFSAEKFLYYVCALKGISKEEGKIKIDELLKFVNLEKDRKRKIGKFSGGMKQRLGIAQALLNDPKILILDEPTAGLDPNERIRFKNLIADISKDKIVILSTHIISDIEFIANEVLVMKDGVLVEQLTPNQMIETVRGKVCSININEEMLHNIQREFKVSNIARENGKLAVRIVGDERPNILGTVCRDEEPNLEDVFLYYFNDEAKLEGGISN